MHEKEQCLASSSPCSWAWLEQEGLLPRAVEILASDTLVPAAQSRRMLQSHRSYGSRTECSKDDYSFSQKDKEMRRAHWKGLVLLAGYAWFRVGGFLFLCTSFTQRSVRASTQGKVNFNLHDCFSLLKGYSDHPF